MERLLLPKPAPSTRPTDGRGTEANVRKESSGCFGGLASCCVAICEPGPPEEEPPYVRLQRMHEERERELKREAEEAKERKQTEERRSLEWQAELEKLEGRRNGMDADALNQDCLSYFATFALLQNDDDHLFNEDSRALEEETPKEEAHEPAAEGEVVRMPDTPLEHWLDAQFRAAATNFDVDALSCRSFGELPAASCADGIASGLADALRESALVADRAIADAEGTSARKDVTVSSALDELIEKYGRDLQSVESGGDAGECNDAEVRHHGGETPLSSAQLEELRLQGKKYRAACERLDALVPCLEGDTASARLASALTALDVGATGVTAATASTTPSFLSPTRALATADVCWALCSEKRHLVVDRLLPGIAAEGVWSWPELRRTGLGWWLSGTELDAVVTKLAQGAVQRLRRESSLGEAFSRTSPTTSTPRIGASDADRSRRRLVDEAVFWYVAGRVPAAGQAVKQGDYLRTMVAQLRALLKTGVLKGEPALDKLLNHTNSEQVQFMWKNALRLLSLHRFHLAASLFVLSGHTAEAAKVVAVRMRDVQLAIVLARRDSQALRPVVRECLEESPLAQRDAWLRFLLQWHAGDVEGASATARTAIQASLEQPPPDVREVLFDGALRLSLAPQCLGDGLSEVARLLFEPP